MGFSNGHTVQSRKPQLLHLIDLPEYLCEEHNIPSLAHISLVSTGKLCDSGCKFEFKAKEVTIKHKVK